MIFVIASLVVLLVLTLLLFLLELRKRKQLQDAAKNRSRNNRKYTRMLDAILENVHAYVLLIDKDFNVLRTNYYERTHKVDNKEELKVGNLLCCRNAILSGMCGTHPKCAECVVRNAIKTSFQQKRSFTDVKIGLTLAVSYERYVEFEGIVSGSYFNIDGEDNLVLTVHDVTELLAGKRENEKLESIVTFTSSISQVGFASLNLLSTDEMITPSYCINLCEKEDERANTVMRTFRYVHTEDREELLDFMQKAESGKVEPFCRDVRVMINNEEWKWIKIFLIQKEYAPECKSNEVYSLSIDINDQKNTEAVLGNEKQKAEDANKSKSAFLANMSHEIRTPLNAIIGFSELLASANTSEEKEQYLQIVRMNNEMLLQLINDILDIAKIEAGILEFNYSDVDINLLTSELDRQFELKLKGNDKLKLIYEPSVPSCVLYTDRNRLTQVLFNFMSNALKFTSSGTIRMGFKPHEKGVYFYVSDTGIGIKEEKLGEVFGRFARFHKEKKGNGLGLSISKTIIEKLGGEIGLTSVYGEGSTFWFILPTDNRFQIDLETQEAEVIDDSSVLEDATSSATASAGEKKYTILIAEDMPDNYHLCAAILSKKYNLLWAKNGEEAVSMYLEHQPDTILMDLKMPEVDGYAATEAIRQLSTTIPIIALTAFAYSEDKDRVMKSGFSDFMTKPVNAGLLLDKVESFCKHYNP